MNNCKYNNSIKELESELPNLKGLFANSKGTQMTKRIQEIEEELGKMDNE